MPNINYVSGMISVLIPTRGRPENVKKVLISGFNNAASPDLVEFLFYVDSDDNSFPLEVLNKNIRIIRGPRMWLSVLQNILYSQAKGEIVMYAGDDIEFRTNGWDQIVRDKFEEFEDKIALVYGDDDATHGEKIAIHGFLHRNWINAVGTWVAPGRGSLYDYWHTEVARKVGRLVFVKGLVIAHIHYRQGAASAMFDDTYKYVYSASRSCVPFLTYRRLERERRIYRILLSEVMDLKPKIERNYLFAETLVKLSQRYNFNGLDYRRIRTLNNFKIMPVIISNIIKILIKKRTF